MNKFFIPVWVVAALALPLSVATATEAPAHFTVVHGKVSLQKPSEHAPIPAVVGAAADFGDVVRTQHRSRAQLKFIDGSLINLSSNYNIEIKEFAYNADTHVRKSVIRSMRGTLRAIVSHMDNQSTFEIETPSAVASVRGTDFFVVIGPDNVTDIVVNDGLVAVRSIDPLIKGEVLVGPSHMTRVKMGSPPVPVRQVPKASLNVLKQQSNPATSSTSGSTASEGAPVAPPAGTPGAPGDALMAMSSSGAVSQTLVNAANSFVLSPPMTPPFTDSLLPRSNVSLTLTFP